MDLDTVAHIVNARSRADLGALSTTSHVLAGGTWLFSEPQDHLTGLVDITTFGWPPLTHRPDGLEIAATATLTELVDSDCPSSWTATPLFRQCCSALVASEKIWNTATVGGNVCLSLPAGAMISLLAALNATVTVWAANGSDYTVDITEFITGAEANVLGTGDVLRSMKIPNESLQSRTAFRKVALAPLGRSGAVVIGRRTHAGAFVLTVTAATTRPAQLRFDNVPSAAEIDDGMAAIDLWYDDPHGTPDWRRHISCVLAQEVREELR